MTEFLTMAENRILKEIALNGTRTRYELFKVAADSTVHNALKKLQKTKLIEVKGEERFARTGKMKRHYGLTLLGLIASLKVAGVHLDYIKNKEEFVSGWVEKAKKLDSESKISQMLDFTELERNTTISKDLEEILMRLMKNPTKETERFLCHYDVQYCDEDLIFHEWVWMPYLASMLYRVSKRVAKK